MMSRLIYSAAVLLLALAPHGCVGKKHPPYRDAVDGWWFKAFVLNDGPPFGGIGNAEDVGDISAGVSN